MAYKKIFWSVSIALAIAFIFSGCGKSDSSDSSGGSSSGSGGASVSGIERDAQNAAVAELQLHWAKGPNGWTSAIISGSPYAPDHFLRQFHDLTAQGVQSYDLSDSDKMNGLEWAGEVTFNKSPCREAGDHGIVLDGLADVTVFRDHGRWSQWVDFQADSLKVQKVKGKWQVNQDTLLLRGKPPTPADFTNAGVQ